MIDLLFLILIVIVAYLAGYNFISLIKLRTNGEQNKYYIHYQQDWDYYLF